MSLYELRLDGTRRVVIEPSITRVYPSLSRAWHGARLTVFVETRWVPDGTAVRLDVFQDGEGEALLTLPDEPAVTGGRASVVWTIDLAEEHLKTPLRRHGASHHLVFDAQVEVFGRALSRRSAPLYLDLTPYVISF